MLLAPVTDEPDEPIVKRIEMVIVDPKEQPWPAPGGRTRLGEACAGGKAPTQPSSRGDDARPAVRMPSF